MDLQLIDFRPHLRDQGAGRYALSHPIGEAIHHTAVFYPARHLTPEDERNHILMIERYHVDTMDYGVFAYHGLAFASGRAYQTGDLTRARSHVAYRNHQLRGFCIAGDYTTVHPHPHALAATHLLLATVPLAAPIKGHRDWAVPDWPTACPGNTYTAWLPVLQSPPNDMTTLVKGDKTDPVYAIDTDGRKRHVKNPAHLDALIRTGSIKNNTVLTLPQATVDAIPEKRP